MALGLSLAAALAGDFVPPASARDEALPPLPAPNDPLEPRQARRSGYAPRGIQLGGLLLHADASVERRARRESFDAAPHLDMETWAHGRPARRERRCRQPAVGWGRRGRRGDGYAAPTGQQMTR